MKLKYYIVSFVVLIVSIELQAIDKAEIIKGTLLRIFNPCNEADGYQDLEYIEKKDPASAQDIENLFFTIFKKLPTEEKSFLSLEHKKRYEAQQIQHIQNTVQKEIERYVEGRVLSRMYQKTAGPCSQKALEYIMTQFRLKYNSSTELPQGIYRDFIGNGLNQQIDDYANYCLARNEPNRYPSKECVYCNYDFVTQPKVFLSCGHDMCKECANNYFFTHKKNSCPTCSSAVDKVDLAKNIFQQR